VITYIARHPVVTIAMIGICLCLGAAAVWQMPVDYLLGQARAPLWVQLTAPAEPGREVVLERLARPFAARLAAEPGIAGHQAWIRKSWAGFSVEPAPGWDQQELAGRLREIAEAVARAGPEDCSSRVWRARSTAERPGLVIQLAGVGRSRVEDQLLPRLLLVPGLRSVELFPHRQRRVRLTVTDADMATAGALRTGLRRISQRNLLGLGAGGVAVVSPPAPESLASLLDQPVFHRGRSRSLAEMVQPAMLLPEEVTRFRVNGREGLFLIVHDDPTLPRRSALGHARELINDWIATQEGATAAVIVDMWQEVLEALGRLARAAAVGLVLAVAALAFALRRLRATLLIATTVPLSLVLALVLLAAAGQGLDVVAIGSLAVAMGLLVDAAVVVGEALASRLETDPLARAVAGVGEAVRPLLLGGLTTIAALAPVWIGRGRDYEVLQGATVPLIAGIAASLIVACTAVPGLAVALGKMPMVRRPRLVARAVKAALRDPVLVSCLVLIPAIGVLMILGPRLAGGIKVGEGDPRSMRLQLSQPAGADIETFNRALAEVEQNLAGLAGVEHVVAVVSGSDAWLWLRLGRRQTTGARRRETVGQILHMVGEGWHWFPYSWRLVDGKRHRAEEPSREQALRRLGVTARGDDPDAVSRAVLTVASLNRQEQRPRSGWRQVRLHPRGPGAGIASRLRPGYRDRQPIEMMIDGRLTSIEVKAPQEPRPGAPPPLEQWLDSAGPAGVTPASLATHQVVDETEWPVLEDGAFEESLQVEVGAVVKSLEQLEQARAEMHEQLRRLPLPDGVSLTVDELEVERPLPVWLLPGSVALVCLLLALGIGFESLLAPLRVLAALVPHLAGAVLLLWLLQVRVNEAAVFGGLLLLGVAVNAGVLIEDRYLARRRTGARQSSAAARAGFARAPTVLLTAATSVLALAPLWLAGVDQLGKPFVAVLGGGLLLGTPATILLLPALQVWGQRRNRQRRIAWQGDGSDQVLLRSLSKSYAGGKVRALSGITTSLEPGLIGLLGPNGAGKTTLIRCVVGALQADTGDVWVNGVPRRDDPQGWRSLVGYLPQSQAVPLKQEARAWLELWASELRLPDPAAAARESLAALGVEDLLDRRLGELSGGQVRRIRIARALLGKPAVLVVDEATTGLDPEARVSLRNLLGQLSRKRLVLFSTHIPEDVAVACRRVLVLDSGAICFDGTTEQMLEQARGKVRRRVVDDGELLRLTRSYRIVSKVRELAGIRVRYLCDRDDDRGEQAEPTLEEAYLWMLAKPEHGAGS
jgi:multidrug efflux pump subunit AcrB/ABC-type multidrug transport system ATPase subunit